MTYGEDYDELQSELAAAIAQASTRAYANAPLDAISALESSDARTAAGASLDLHDAAKRIVQLVQRDGRFPGTDVRFIRQLNGSFGFYPQFVGEPLIKRAIKSGDPREAIRWLQRVLGATHADGHSVVALWGIAVSRREVLTTDVEIIPIGELPDSPQKRWIKGLAMNQMNGSPFLPMQLDEPQSAIVMKHRIEPVVVAPDSPPAISHASQLQFTQACETISEVTLALTAVGPRLPIVASQWFSFDDPDFEDAGKGHGRSWYMTEILPQTMPAAPRLDTDEARTFVGDYLKLHGETRAQVRVALQRLNYALRRHGPGDHAVELCTALEALMGDKATTEMTHKVTVRATRLIGGDARTRRRTAAIIGRVYAMRSKLVHTGRVDVNAEISVDGNRLLPADVTVEADSLCAKLIRKIAAAGGIPKWSEFDIN